jgi:hypothetical protein
MKRFKNQIRIRVIRGREESVSCPSPGVPQEEVQKKPQLGTTQ